jgi:hypothetical protein
MPPKRLERGKVAENIDEGKPDMYQAPSLQTRPVLRAAVALAAVLAGLTLVAGCSRVDIAYRTSDILIEYYADDYLDLDSTQLAGWRPALREAMSRHREEELPYLARFFDTAYEGSRKGFDRNRVDCLVDQLEALYRRHLDIAVELAAPLLADLTPGQIRKLDVKFADEAAEEAEEDTAAVARRERKRAERYAESMDWWFGALTDAQHRIVEDVTAAMPDTAAAWEAYRSDKRNQLVALLRRGAGERAIRAFLYRWLVEHRDMPAELQRARSAIREQITRLFLDIDRSFSERQRAHFSDRLASLRDDFLSLQDRPRMASVACAKNL